MAEFCSSTSSTLDCAIKSSSTCALIVACGLYLMSNWLSSIAYKTSHPVASSLFMAFLMGWSVITHNNYCMNSEVWSKLSSCYNWNEHHLLCLRVGHPTWDSIWAHQLPIYEKLMTFNIIFLNLISWVIKYKELLRTNWHNSNTIEIKWSILLRFQKGVVFLRITLLMHWTEIISHLSSIISQNC